MRKGFNLLLTVVLCGLSLSIATAQCPPRPSPGTVVQDALNLPSTGGVLSANMTMKSSVDGAGYTHYCYIYKTDTGEVESPTLRLNQGDTLVLGIKNRIEGDDANMSMVMNGSGGSTPVCGDTGTMTVSSTNVHYHGLNVPPKCHQDEVVNTLIQPGTDGFQYKIQIPTDEPPGLYWYHPHIHGFTEFQVNGGAAGALIVEGMDKIHPQVSGLTERVFVLRQQFLVPWIPGPYQLTLNYEPAVYPNFPSPVIQMQPNTKEFWRVANATNQDFMPLQVQFNGVAQKVELVAMDGYPLPQTRFVDTILLPPASRAEFIVDAPPTGVDASFLTLDYSTGPTGNPDLFQILGNMVLSTDAPKAPAPKPAQASQPAAPPKIKYTGLRDAKVTANRKLFFSEEFAGTNGPIQFYITVDGQQQKVFEPDEKPAITTKVGAVEDWVIENHALETHAFHIHQIHFMLLEVDGKPVANQDLRDTIEVPFWEGPGHPYHKVKVRMDFRDPNIAGTFVFHCHILLHEDLGMMHKILVLPQ